MDLYCDALSLYWCMKPVASVSYSIAAVCLVALYFALCSKPPSYHSICLVNCVFHPPWCICTAEGNMAIPILFAMRWRKEYIYKQKGYILRDETGQTKQGWKNTIKKARKWNIYIFFLFKERRRRRRRRGDNGFGSGTFPASGGIRERVTESKKRDDIESVSCIKEREDDWIVW